MAPIPQADENDDAVVKINYQEEFTDCYNYFRRVYEDKIISEDALALTKHAAELNPANYTVWHQRRVILEVRA